MVLRRFWEVFGGSERVWNGFKWFSEGFRRFLEDFRRVRGGVRPRRGAGFRPPKEGRISGEGGICGEVSRVEVPGLRPKTRNALRARRGGG